jgi:hypothetical protein
MIGLTCRRNVMRFTQTQKKGLLSGYSVRNLSATTFKFADIDMKNDMYRLNLPLKHSRLVFEVSSNHTLSEFEDHIKSADESISKVDFYSVDGGPGTSFLPKSESLLNFESTPFLLTLNDNDTFVVNL